MESSLRIRLTPRAARNEIVRWEAGVLSVRVTAPPVDSAANEALIQLLADGLKIRKTAIRIKSGASSREKLLILEGMDEETLYERLNGLCSS
jgi:uncharacterized protein (TIGR00251 family)